MRTRSVGVMTAATEVTMGCSKPMVMAYPAAYSTQTSNAHVRGICIFIVRNMFTQVRCEVTEVESSYSSL